MIIFDLDGTLADCEHRRHFVNCINYRQENNGYEFTLKDGLPNNPWIHKETKSRWKPDWKAFYEACDKDLPIWPVINLINGHIIREEDIYIWSGRSESVRDKTIIWLREFLDVDQWFYRDCLKMRPIGDNTTDDQLKERWLDELMYKETLGIGYIKHPIDFVFDSHPNSIAMWRRRGIFVFDVNQSGKEF